MTSPALGPSQFLFFEYDYVEETSGGSVGPLGNVFNNSFRRHLQLHSLLQLDSCRSQSCTVTTYLGVLQNKRIMTVMGEKILLQFLGKTKYLIFIYVINVEFLIAVSSP